LLLLLALLTLPTVGFFLLQVPGIQNKIIHRVSEKVSLYLGAPVSIKEIRVDLFANIHIREFCVRTPKRDTVLFSPDVKIKLNTFSLSSRFLEIRSLSLLKPDIHFSIDSVGNVNFQFIIDKLTQNKDTTGPSRPMVVSVRRIEIKDADFVLKGYQYVPRPYGINFTDVHLSDLNLEVTNFRIDKGVSMNIRKLSGTEKSGLRIDRLSSRFMVRTDYMVFNHLTIVTPKSDIHAKQVRFLFANLRELKPIVFGKNVKLNVELEPSDVSSDDLAWFLPILKDYHMKVRMSGHAYGLFTELKCRDFDVTYGDRTSLKANVDINGLPDINNAFIHVDFKKLYTTPADIQKLNIPQLASKHIALPANFQKVSFISYKGKFTGYLNDFVAYGTLESNLGQIETDLLFKPDTAKTFRLNGRLKTVNFDIGTFAGQTPLIGTISMNAMVDATVGGGHLEAQMNGGVSNFQFKGYNYQNITVNGSVNGKTYEGSVTIDDPNLQLDFLGKVALDQQAPDYAFTANVRKGRPFALNLDKRDSTAVISFTANSAFTGNNIDDFRGNVVLTNLVFHKNGKDIKVNNIEVVNKDNKLKNQVLIHSDFLEAEMWGNYKFSQLAASFKHFIRGFAPSLLAESSGKVDTIGNFFCFKADLYDTRAITEFFVPGLYISKDSKLSGIYDMGINNFNFRMNIPLLQHKTRKFYNVNFTSRTVDQKLSMVMGCDSLQMNKQFNFPNLTVLMDVAHDTIEGHVRWNNWDSTSYRGNINLVAALSPSKGKWPKLDARLQPSLIVLSDTMWQIPSGQLRIDSTMVAIDNFSITHGKQKMQVQGKVSDDPNDELHVEVQNVNLANLSTVINTKKLSFGGTINGGINFYNLYHNPAFRSQVDVDTLIFNQVPIGKTNISATYSNSEKVVNVDAWTDRNGLKTINLKGKYIVPTQALDFDIILDKLKLDPFEPYLAVLFSNVKGKASGNLTLKGTTSTPVIQGVVNAQKVGFKVKFLNTTYSTSDTIIISNNTFILKDVKVYDDEARTAFVNGTIEYRKLKELYVDLGIKAANFHCLNTTKKDNKLFYGQAFATGDVGIKVSPQGVFLDIDATSNAKTQISIPIETRTELSEANYIKIVNKSRPQENFYKQYEIDQHVTQSNSAGALKFNMNLTMHATPDAVVNLVFDEKSGDKITGTGSGDLNLSLSSGNFTIDGIYTVQQGEYLYTAGRILNKKFLIQNGGTIAWTGNPLDAIVNIDAVYSLRGVSLASLNSSSTASEALNKRISADCKLSITDKLMKPNVKYGINFPNIDQETQNMINQYIATDEQMTNQFISLLFSNQFYAESGSSGGSTGSSVGTMLGIEFLSNQLMRMMRQGNSNLDIGFNIKPGDEQKNNQMVEVAVSRKFFNDKLTISGNVDYGTGTSSSSSSGNPTPGEKNSGNFIGEGYMEYEVTKKIRVKAFNRANQTYEDKSPYTQGVGIFYREDFNSFSELWDRMFHSSARKEDKDSTSVKKIN
jgi:hypothetical protein